MSKFIIMMALSFIITQIIHILFSEDKSGQKTYEEFTFKVILQQGVIGCISQDSFDEVQKLYQQKRNSEIKKYLTEKKCYIFAKDEEFQGLENYCNEDSKHFDNHMFSSKRFLLSKIILPCYGFRNYEN
ncbi:hypothetical protein LBMAG18_00110 [Alphaproteobacteria bacterium]|nr:hypothetical protein LBMAG18_00110 [Alphaproteobacteria bacterium]